MIPKRDRALGSIQFGHPLSLSKPTQKPASTMPLSKPKGLLTPELAPLREGCSILGPGKTVKNEGVATKVFGQVSELLVTQVITYPSVP